MNAAVSRIAVVRVIVKKDLKEFLQDRLWISLSALGLIFYVGIFWLLPNRVDETITVGIYQSGLDRQLSEQLLEAEAEGLEIVFFESSERLRQAVAGETGIEKEIRIGIDFPEDFLFKTLLHQKTTVRVYVAAGVPEEIKMAISSMVREIAYMVSGEDLPVTEPDDQTVVLGEDRIGNQVPFRDKMRPMMVFFILMVETFALASLIAGEIQAKTMTAVLVTPARFGDVLAAKTILGTFLAFAQAVILLLALDALGHSVIFLLCLVLMASVMVAGIGMITGSAAKDFMGTLLYGGLFMILLTIPALKALFPGLASPWIKLLPSYGIVEGMMGATVYGKGWKAFFPLLSLVAVWDIIILGSGLLILKKRVEAL